MNIEQLLLTPPLALGIILGVLLLLDALLARYSRRTAQNAGETDPYACGQRNVPHYVSPDYTQFYPYAVLFTLTHAAILLIAAVPSGSTILPSVSVFVTLAMLYLVFRKVK